MIKIPETIQVFLENPQPRVYQGLLDHVGALKRESRQYKEEPGLLLAPGRPLLPDIPLLLKIPRAKHLSTQIIWQKATPTACLFRVSGQHTSQPMSPGIQTALNQTLHCVLEQIDPKREIVLPKLTAPARAMGWSLCLTFSLELFPLFRPQSRAPLC